MRLDGAEHFTELTNRHDADQRENGGSGLVSDAIMRVEAACKTLLCIALKTGISEASQVQTVELRRTCRKPDLQEIQGTACHFLATMRPSTSRTMNAKAANEAKITV